VRLAHQSPPSSETASSKPRERNQDETSLTTSSVTPRAYVSLRGHSGTLAQAGEVLPGVALGMVPPFDLVAGPDNALGGDPLGVSSSVIGGRCVATKEAGKARTTRVFPLVRQPVDVPL
jgi:hypothetical protein